MKDGEGCSIRLVETRLEGTVTLYVLQLEVGQSTYRLSARYSKLRSISALLPKVTPFPSRPPASSRPRTISPVSSVHLLETQAS